MSVSLQNDGIRSIFAGMILVVMKGFFPRAVVEARAFMRDKRTGGNAPSSMGGCTLATQGTAFQLFAHRTPRVMRVLTAAGIFNACNIFQRRRENITQNFFSIPFVRLYGHHVL